MKQKIAKLELTAERLTILDSPLTWTRFMDMNSGGGQKENWAYIYIPADEAQAKIIFYNIFGHNPERVTCTCCGDDYFIESSDSFACATPWDRGCPYVGKGYDLAKCEVTIADYAARPTVLVVYPEQIKPEDTKGEVPSQGYVWVE